MVKASVIFEGAAVAYHIRPNYSEEISLFLCEETSLLRNEHPITVVDLASGSGKFRQVIQKALNTAHKGEHNVIGVEPNDALRAMDEPGKAIKGEGMATNLPGDTNAHIVTIANAEHWVVPHALQTEENLASWVDALNQFRQELKRIAPEGWYAAVSNNFDEAHPLSRKFHEFCLSSSAFPTYFDNGSGIVMATAHRNTAGLVEGGAFRYRERVYEVQWDKFQFVEFMGSVSSSPKPTGDEKLYQNFVVAMGSFFDENAVDGKIRFQFAEKVRFGKIRSRDITTSEAKRILTAAREFDTLRGDEYAIKLTQASGQIPGF